MIFYKLHGAGNDFIFFVDQAPEPHKAALLCNRQTGIGADGVVWLTRLGGSQFKWDFYNSDGSPAEMCGNAARCAMRLVSKEFLLPRMELETAAGIVVGTVVGDDIAVSFDIANTPILEVANPAGTGFSKGYFLTTGVPHCVIPTQKPFDLKSRGSELAVHIKNPAFGAKGSNLTFTDFERTPVEAVTLERGVDDFTLACGTGVIATARVHKYLNKTTEPLKIKTPGGSFTVKFDGLKATLTGPAEFVFRGDLWNHYL